MGKYELNSGSQKVRFSSISNEPLVRIRDLAPRRNLVPGDGKNVYRVTRLVRGGGNIAILDDVESESNWPARRPRWARHSLMYSFRWQFLMHLTRRQITTMVLLVAVLGAQLPIPLVSPSITIGKDHSRPFPCQDRPCGCRSAEQCKKKCCCFSVEQKLAWAKRNGVMASEVVANMPNCKTDAVAVRKGCCSSKSVGNQQGKSPLSKSTTKSASRYRVVIGTVAQECQGVARALSGQSVFVIPASISLPSRAMPRGERLIVENSRFAKLMTEPPVPPPRLFAA